MKEALSKRFCYCTLVCCLRFLVPAWNWWLINNNSGEKEIKITTPTNSELDPVFQWISFGFFKVFLVLEKLNNHYLKNCFWYIFHRPGCGWCDSKIQLKLQPNDIPLKIWHMWENWLMSLSGINHTFFIFSVLVLFFVFVWYESGTIYYGSLWMKDMHHLTFFKKEFGTKCLAML